MGSSDATRPRLSQGSQTWSGSEQEVLSFPVIACLEDAANLLARAFGAHRAQHQRLTGPRKIASDAHGPAAGEPLLAVDVVERAGPQAVRLKLAREAFPSWPGAPDIKRSAGGGPAREIVCAQTEHRRAQIPRPDARRAAGRTPPLQQHLRHLRQRPAAGAA